MYNTYMSNALRIRIIHSLRHSRTQSPCAWPRWLSKMASARCDESKQRKRSSNQLSLEASLDNLRELSNSLETKKVKKNSEFFLAYDDRGKRLRNPKHKYRCVAERTANKKQATWGASRGGGGRRGSYPGARAQKGPAPNRRPKN